MGNKQLPSEVFLVPGARHSCIYDMRKDPIQLFHLDEEASEFLSRYLLGSCSELSGECEKFIVELQEFGLLEVTDKFSPEQPLSLLNTYSDSASASSVWIEITSTCDQKCIHCYGSYPAQGRTMTHMEIDRVAEQVTQCGIPHVQIIGGEPLMAWEETRYFIETHGPKFESLEIFTNGLLLDETKLNWLVEKKVRISVSTYGTTREHYRAIAGETSLFQVHKVLFPRLEASGGDFKVCLMRMRGNDHETLQGVADFYGIPLNRMRQDIVRMTGRAQQNLLTERLLRDCQLGPEAFRRPIRKSQVIRNVAGHSCFGMKVYIASDLRTYPCAMERRVSYGSLEDHTLSEIISQSHPTRRLTKDGIEGCRECEFRYACYDCRPNNGSQDFFAKPWFCRYNPRIGVWEHKINSEVVL